MDPDILIVDEALSVGDIFFQQRFIRRIQQLKHQGVTILFVSHYLGIVRSLADRVIWMEHGQIVLQGKTEEVVSKYLAAMVTRGRKEIMEEEAMGKPLVPPADLEMSAEALARIPAFIEHLPNVDHRYGNGKARITGVGVRWQSETALQRKPNWLTSRRWICMASGSLISSSTSRSR